jgi:CRISPR/Cas system-associated exonuclease Cas4 (RecB family)
MRKFFNNFLVERHNLITENTESGRFYRTPKGRFRSVTTVITEKQDKRWLEAWRARVGELEAKRITTQSARLGTAVHNIAERYLLNIDPYVDKAMPLHVEAFKPIKKALDASVDHVYGAELPLYSVALKAAGKTDVVAQYDCVNSVIDFKTSRRIKKECDIEGYFLQSTAYSLMFETMYGISVPRIVIIMTVTGENEPLLFVKDRGKYVNKVINLFRE